MYNIKSGDKLYIVVRKDIKPGLALAQSCHVAFEFAKRYPEETENWMINSNYIAVLAARDEEELIYLICKAEEQGIKCSIFREPDMGNEMTAVALEASDASKILCQHLRLALK